VKIVHLTWGLGVGGAEVLLRDIAGIQAAGNETWVVVANADVDTSVRQALDPRVRLETLGRPPGSRNPWYLFRLVALLRRIKPDVIHAHQASFARLRGLVPSPLLLTVHNTRLPLSGRLDAFRSICCISEAVRHDVESRFPGLVLRVIYNGIPFAAVKPKARYGGTPFRIVQISRLAHAQKGQDLLIRALRLVLDRLGDAAASVDFIGEGESLDYLRGLAADQGVESHCRFLGGMTRQRIYEELQGYDLLVQPSRYEGFGLTVIEAIAACVPVLVADIEGPMEIIDGGRLGASFRSEDVADLARGLIGMITLSLQPEFPAQMRARTVQAAARFDVARTAQAYLDEYARLTSVADVMPAETSRSSR